MRRNSFARLASFCTKSKKTRKYYHGQKQVCRVCSANFCSTKDKRQQSGDTQSRYHNHSFCMLVCDCTICTSVLYKPASYLLLHLRTVVYPWSGPASEPSHQLFAQCNLYIVHKFLHGTLRYARPKDSWIVVQSTDPWFEQCNLWIVQIHTLHLMNTCSIFVQHH